jgi:hypothetical protein
MTATKRAPRIVAELGRPETPEESAARLAENSRKYRARKTVNNLVLSLLATLVTVLVLVLLVPRSDKPIERNINYRSVASQVQTGVDEPLMSPVLPVGWRANVAEWRTGGGSKVPSWYIGLLTPRNEFIAATQALNANPTWLNTQLQGAPAADTVTIDGVKWDIYRNTAPEKDRGNFDYALVTAAGRSTYLLVGTALAHALATDVTKNVGGGK